MSPLVDLIVTVLVVITGAEPPGIDTSPPTKVAPPPIITFPPSFSLKLSVFPPE